MLLADGQYRDGDICLVGGSYQWEGRVEIYFSGTWGTITDSNWTSDDAQVVCHKLGHFKPGVKVLCMLIVVTTLSKKLGKSVNIIFLRLLSHYMNVCRYSH